MLFWKYIGNLWKFWKSGGFPKFPKFLHVLYLWTVSWAASGQWTLIFEWRLIGNQLESGLGCFRTVSCDFLLKSNRKSIRICLGLPQRFFGNTCPLISEGPAYTLTPIYLYNWSPVFQVQSSQTANPPGCFQRQKSLLHEIGFGGLFGFFGA